MRISRRKIFHQYAQFYIKLFFKDSWNLREKIENCAHRIRMKCGIVQHLVSSEIGMRISWMVQNWRWSDESNINDIWYQWRHFTTKFTWIIDVCVIRLMHLMWIIEWNSWQCRWERGVDSILGVHVCNTAWKYEWANKSNDSQSNYRHSSLTLELETLC